MYSRPASRPERGVGFYEMVAPGSASRKWLWLALAAALALRLSLVAYAEAGGRFAFGDGRFYVELGRALAAGRGLSISADVFQIEGGRGEWTRELMARWRRTGLWDFVVPGRPTAFVMPLYPLFVGGVFFLAGRSVLAVRLAQLLVGLAVPALAYYVGRRAFGRRAGILAAWSAAIYPFFIFFTASVTNQLFSITLLLALAAAYYRFKESTSGAGAALFGAVAGAAFLTRAELLVAAGAAAAFVFFADRRRKGYRFALARLAIAAAVGLAAATPWAVRNAVAMGRFSYFATQAPRVLWEANVHPFSEEFTRGEVPAYAALYDDLRRDATPGLRRRDLVEMPRFEAEGEYARARVLGDRVAAFLEANPGVYGRLCLIRASQFLRLEPLNFGGLPYRLSYIFYAVLLAAALAGVVVSLRRSRPYFLYALAAYGCAPLILFIYGTSYRVGSLDPVLIIFGAFAFERGWAVVARFRGRRA